MSKEDEMETWKLIEDRKGLAIEWRSDEAAQSKGFPKIVRDGCPDGAIIRFGSRYAVRIENRPDLQEAAQAYARRRAELNAATNARYEQAQQARETERLSAPIPDGCVRVAILRHIGGPVDLCRLPDGREIVIGEGYPRAFGIADVPISDLDRLAASPERIAEIEAQYAPTAARKPTQADMDAEDRQRARARAIESGDPLDTAEAFGK